jgi:hypothetical protein
MQQIAGRPNPRFTQNHQGDQRPGPRHGVRIGDMKTNDPTFVPAQ